MVPSKLLSAVLLAACPLAAQAPSTYDVQVGSLSAQGDFRSEVGSKSGIDLGLSMTVPLLPRLAVRPRLTFERFPGVDNAYAYKSSRYSDRGSETAEWSAWCLGADCLFRPTGGEGRLYFVAGAFFKSWRLRSHGSYTTQDRLNTTRTFTVDDSSTSNEPAVDLGIGLRVWRNLSLESRMTLASYRKLSYNTLQVGVVASF